MAQNPFSEFDYPLLGQFQNHRACSGFGNQREDKRVISKRAGGTQYQGYNCHQNNLQEAKAREQSQLGNAEKQKIIMQISAVQTELVRMIDER